MKKAFCGRSMVEMLGVLAVIGVLSIMAVWGIRRSFVIHKTNQLMEDVKMAGFLVTADNMIENFAIFDPEEGAPVLDLKGTFTPKTSYEFYVFKESSETYAIVVLDVEEEVCLEVKKRQMDWLEEIRANGTDDSCRKDQPNDMSFFFNTSLNNTITPENDTCRSDRDCSVSKPYCNRGVCRECGVGKFKASNGNCYNCGNGSATTPDECHACGNYILNSASSCVPCDSSTQAIRFSNSIQARTECAICTNRIYTSTGHSAERFCALPCTTAGEFLDDQGRCRSCNSDTFHIGWSNLTQDREIYNDLMEKCNNCPNMVRDDAANITCVNFNSTQKTHIFTPAHCKQYFKGKRYVAKATWVYECTLCPEKNTSAWNDLNDEQREDCTPASGL